MSATDRNDAVAPFSETGAYVTVAAPGVGVPVVVRPRRLRVGRRDQLRDAVRHRHGRAAALGVPDHVRPSRIRNRIIATADSPPATVPDPAYGYGIVNPYRAVTALRNDAPPPSPVARTALLPAPRPAAARPDHHTRDVALGSAAVLLGLGVLAVAGAAVLRGAVARRPAR